MILIAATCGLIVTIIYKILYPYPNFLPDSYSYIDAALKNQAINKWPIGYSKFLRFFNFITHSNLALVVFQYIILQTSILYFVFSVAYFFNISKLELKIIILFLAVNPLLLHLSNFISSDTLFTSLSLIWFTQLLWLLNNLNKWLLFFHALILLMAFMTRYNAMYYPLISLFVILFAPITGVLKWLGIGLILSSLGAFIGYTQYNYKKETNTVQFSPFGGWQLASNALYAYSHVSPEERASPPIKFKDLHSITNQHIDSLNKLAQRPDNDLGIYYLWNPESPLLLYMYNLFLTTDSSKNGFTKWALMGPYYHMYGQYVIKQYPAKYMKYYIWPNLINYWIPQTEFLGSYNMQTDTVHQIAVKWFHLKNNKVGTYSKSPTISITEYFSFLWTITNIVFVSSFMGFIFLQGFKHSNNYAKKILLYFLIVWIFNMLFSVIASPIVLRYQIFPLIVTFTFMILLISFIVKINFGTKENEHRYQKTAIQL